MKNTDLHKNAGLKIKSELKRSGSPDRFGSASAILDKRAQRKLDQAQGLVAFAVKLDGVLVKQIQARALVEQKDMNATVAALLNRGLAQ